MHPLDFISQSPQTFIFQKEANKTNLGGLLFLIYLIICLGIFLYYLLDYTENNKFEVQYTYNQNDSFIDDEEKKKDNKFNPEIGVIVELKDKNNEFLSENFLIIKNFRNPEGYWNGKYYGYAFSERACDIDIEIYYKCYNEHNCSLRNEDKRESYLLEFWYSRFFLDHQNKTLPIYKNNITYTVLTLEFSFYTKIKKNFDWQVIKYIDKGGLFSSVKEYYGGSMKSKDIFIYDPPYPQKEIYNADGTFTYYDFLYKIKVDSNYDFYDEYIRTKVSWLNIFSNSFSLMMSFYSGFKIVFYFLYAKNFNNYKIVQNILSTNSKLNLKEKKNIELYSDFSKLGQLINNQNEQKDIITIKDENSDKENLIENNNEYNENQNNNNNNKEDSFELPKLHLFDFIFNTFYLCKKFKCKNQNMISTSNEILLKYFSIERILYNQIKFENLMKDYRWNNPRQKSIQNNELIIKLKNYMLNT